MTPDQERKILRDVQEMKAYHQLGLAKCQKIEDELAPVSTGASKKKKSGLSDEDIAKRIARKNRGRNIIYQ